MANEIRGTGHIYGSGQKSVIQRTIADSTLKKKDELRPNITPNEVAPRGNRAQPDQLRSSDVYYANQEGTTRTPQLVKIGDMQSLPQQGSSAQAVPHNQSTHLVEIRSARQISAKVKEGIAASRNGVGTVRVLLWNKDWAQKVRTLIDLAVTREEITESQGRDFQLGVHQSAMDVNVVDKVVTKEEAPPAIEAPAASQMAVAPEDLVTEDAPEEDDDGDVSDMLDNLENTLDRHVPVSEEAADEDDDGDA